MEQTATPDEALAIARAVLDRAEAAIAARDLTTLDELCVDGTVIFGSAAASFGAAATREYLRTVAEANTVRWLLDRWAVLHADGDRVLVAATGQVEFDDGSGPERAGFRLTLLLVRADDAWRIGHFHGSLPAA